MQDPSAKLPSGARASRASPPPRAPRRGLAARLARVAGRWLKVSVLAVIPFVAGLLVAVFTPVDLRSSVSPLMAAAVVILGVPLWFVVAEALAAGLGAMIKNRAIFLIVDAIIGYALLVLLYSMLIFPLWAAAACALAAAVCWWLTAGKARRAYAAANATARKEWSL